jgi:two-component system chemotaxis response regulator CheY
MQMSSPESSTDLTKAERSVANILVVEPEPSERNLMRTMLNGLGYPVVSESPNHLASLEKFEGRKFTHIIFDAKKGNCPMQEWFSQVLEIAPSIIAIPSSSNPSVDDVFELLLMGAKGYLVKPFTRDTLDLSVTLATKGEPIPDIVRQARDRNEALVALMMSSLDRLATVHRQSKQFETALRELPRAEAALRRASDLALMFAKGGEEGLVGALERFCVEKSRGPATRLGRLRKRLSTTRVVDDPKVE